MELVLATFGGILLLLSLSLGSILKTNLAQMNQSVPTEDRVAGVLIGISLIAVAVVLWINAPLISLLSSFGVTAGLTVLYALYLLLARPR
jgi:xanthine/uracil permease